MGETAIPYFLNPMFDINEKLLLEVLNSPNAFDKELNFKRGNRLEVFLFNHSTSGDNLYFNFRYTGKLWTAIDGDVFDLMSRFDKVIQGEIKVTE
ncbi:hypothetical protein M0G43_08465 [Subsaxibacter sp. CAU 1640]|uniref:hypothetical protein n=1 Tax=Subsaxibacter sp. CAU 1640 TaxID=2933271 RepID=UPI0020045D91|nr:hypothetical protein [Subsaxibacter sp. CAU 1640]MCK7590603.1 hypothetical protein [Subsaxibacter sp. CAU 1640]